jgi:hypothetical protein
VPLTADGVGTKAITRRTVNSKTLGWGWQKWFMEEGFDYLLHGKGATLAHPSARSRGS